MKQFQVMRNGLAGSRIAADERPEPEIGDGEICLKIDKFGFSANNITYGIAGETLGYWKFFKQLGSEDTNWGLLPVWGFADVTASKCTGIEPGERLFGYFPPSSHLVMQPVKISELTLFDGSAHRAELPVGYNMYRRVNAETGYKRAYDDLRMLLYPLYLTSFAIWDQLSEFDWYDAEQILIVSASAKTSIGLAVALKNDPMSPKVVGLTSSQNTKFVEELGYYDQTIPYDEIEQKCENVPSVIVDMAGNASTLGRLHAHLGSNLKKNIDVGITDWRGFGRDERINRDVREFFFAPSRIQKRMKDWGVEEFNKKTNDFIMETSKQSGAWLKLEHRTGLDPLNEMFEEIRDGKISPNRGLIFEV